MEELLRVLIGEQTRARIAQEKNNELLEIISCQRQDGKNPNELLTIEQVHKEFNIGINMVRKIFQDKELPVQRYTQPFKVTRQAFEKYLNANHDYLCER